MELHFDQGIRHLWIGIIAGWLLTSCTSGQADKEQTKERTSAETAKVEEVSKPLILFFGNSITAGYQLDIQEAFPALIQDRLDTLGFNYRVVNAGLSGETTASGKSRIDWVLREKPDIFVLELGANDGLRGLPLTETKSNLQAIIDKVKAINPDVKIMIAGMQVPPNLGIEYTEDFKGIFPEIAKQNDATLIPFLLEGVAGNPDLNLSDGIHPTPEGHRILSITVWRYLEPLLTKPTSL